MGGQEEYPAPWAQAAINLACDADVLGMISNPVITENHDPSTAGFYNKPPAYIQFQGGKSIVNL